jgi:hypothetical protein
MPIDFNGKSPVAKPNTFGDNILLTKDWELGNVTFRPNCNNITYNGQPCTSIRTTTRIDGRDFSGDTALYCSVNATRADVEAEYARINRPTYVDHNADKKCASTPLTKALKSLEVARAYVAECNGKLADARKGEAKEAEAVLVLRIEAVLAADNEITTDQARKYLTAKRESMAGATFRQRLDALCSKKWAEDSFGIRTNVDGMLRYGDGVDASTETALWCTLEQIVEIAESGDEVPDWYQD